MSFKSLSTHVVDDRECTARLRMTASVARVLGAEVIGLVARGALALRDQRAGVGRGLRNHPGEHAAQHRRGGTAVQGTAQGSGHRHELAHGDRLPGLGDPPARARRRPGGGLSHQPQRRSVGLRDARDRADGGRAAGAAAAGAGSALPGRDRPARLEEHPRVAAGDFRGPAAAEGGEAGPGGRGLPRRRDRSSRAGARRRRAQANPTRGERRDPRRGRCARSGRRGRCASPRPTRAT